MVKKSAKNWILVRLKTPKNKVRRFNDLGLVYRPELYALSYTAHSASLRNFYISRYLTLSSYNTIPDFKSAQLVFFKLPFLFDFLVRFLGYYCARGLVKWFPTVKPKYRRSRRFDRFHFVNYCCYLSKKDLCSFWGYFVNIFFANDLSQGFRFRATGQSTNALWFSRLGVFWPFSFYYKYLHSYNPLAMLGFSVSNKLQVKFSVRKFKNIFMERDFWRLFNFPLLRYRLKRKLSGRKQREMIRKFDEYFARQLVRSKGQKVRSRKPKRFIKEQARILTWHGYFMVARNRKAEAYAVFNTFDEPHDN